MLQRLAAAGRFAVSMLGEWDEAVSAMAGTKAADKFEQIGLTTTSGHQEIDGASAWFACELESFPVDAVSLMLDEDCAGRDVGRLRELLRAC